ncbi:hypothetical protein HN51_011704 [Arachis hypogaea]
MSRLAPTYKTTWKSLGIVYALKLATFNLSYTTPVLRASLYFWYSAINNFHFPYGMMGPTLMEVSVLTGIASNRECVSWATEYPDDIFDINFDSTFVSGFIQNNMGFEGDPMTDSEHVAFMLLWLNAFVFCLKSIQIQKNNYPPPFLLAPCREIPLFWFPAQLSKPPLGMLKM